MAKPPPNQPWDRQPGESNPAWSARRIYIQMGQGRTQERVAEECRKSVGLIHRWSSRWSWVATARAFDEHVDKAASKVATDKAVADQLAKRQRLEARREEFPELINKVFVETYNDIAIYSSEVKQGTREPNHNVKSSLIRSFATMVPLQADSIAQESNKEFTAAQVAAQAGETPIGHVPGRALAVLRAFNEYRESTTDENHGTGR